MGKARKHLGAGLVVMACLALGAPAVAAENSIRMPVDKGAAPDPLGEMMKDKKSAAQAAAAQKSEQKKDEPTKDDPKKTEQKKTEKDKPEEKQGAAKRLEPASVARGEAKKPDQTKPEAKKPEAQKSDVKKPEVQKSDAQKPAAKTPDPNKPEAKKAPVQKAEVQKPEAKQADAKKAEAKSPETTKAAEAPAPKPAKPAASKPEAPAPKAEAAPAPAPAPAAKPADNATAPVAAQAPAPKPAPKPYVDPAAFVMPAGPSGGAPAHVELPAEGLFLGDLSVEFQHTQLILRAATSREVERVTWFYLKDLRRLALDLRGNWGRKGPATLRYDTGPVKHIVSGEHPDRLRLVVEFREGAVRPDLDPVVVREGGGGVTVTIPLAR